MSTATIVGGQPRIKILPDGRRELLQLLAVNLGQHLPKLDELPGVWLLRGDTVVTVPIGFVTDLSSIPWWARMFMGRFDRHDIGGIVHDWLYHLRAPRRAADKAWRIIARSGRHSVNAVQGLLGWIGLRLGGWRAYSKSRARV